MLLYTHPYIYLQLNIYEKFDVCLSVHRNRSVEKKTK